MHLTDALGVLLRRWIVVLAGLALTCGGCFAVLSKVEPDYQATGQMLLLLPPEATGVESPTSPFLNFQAGLSTAGSLVAGRVATKDAQRELAAEGLTATYAVALAPEAGPLLQITAKAKDPAVALATRDAVMERITADLASIQKEARVPERQIISTQISSTSKEAEVLPGSRIRALAGAGGAGLLLTLLLAFGIDRIATARRLRRERALAVDLEEVPEDVPEEPRPSVRVARGQRGGRGADGPSAMAS
jgi:capsular polysaccharide biosynthesis protein